MTKRKLNFICKSCNQPFERPDKKRLHCTDACHFWSKVEKTDTCWLWIAGGHKFGYGEFRESGKLIRAHRFSYELHNGPIKDSKSVLHTCDNPRCVNPNHLYIGTQIENGRDTSIRDRVGTRKLTPSDIPEIRKQLSANEADSQISKKFGVTAACIYSIRSGKTWRYA